MPILDLFVNEKKINHAIEVLENKKRNLPEIIDTEIKSILKKKFPDKEYDDIIKDYGDPINRIKKSLCEEYLKEIEEKIEQLYILGKEVSN